MPAICSAVFIALCWLILRYPGVENDEALFTASLYRPWDLGPREFSLGIFHQRVPLMLMSYLGTFKTLLYRPVFYLFPPSVISLRLPPVILGAATIWIFYRLVAEITDRRAAAIATILFSTDVAFILTNTFDWGPVALQHLLLVAALLTLVQFHRKLKGGLLALGFFLLGLALWDKALFLWSLSGLGIGALIVFPRELIRHFSVRNVAVAAAAIVLGSAPLIIYNVRSHGGTLAQNASLSPQLIPGKLVSLRNTLDGSGMAGYLTWGNEGTSPRAPLSAGQKFSVWFAAELGDRHTNFNEALLLLSALLLPFLWRTPARKPLLFFMIFLVVAWTQMAMTRGAGATVHHVVLLWPVPFLVIGIALAQASRPLGRVGLVAVVCITGGAAVENLIVYNEYRAQLITYGAKGVWSDAIFTLEDRVLKAYPNHHLYIEDWGPMNPLRLLGRGRLNLVGLPFDASAQMSPGLRSMVLESMADPANVFIAPLEGFEVFPGVADRVTALAREAGFQEIALETVHDGNGRAVYHLVSYRPQDQGRP